MKREDVAEMSSMNRFFYWIRERHQIFKKRRAGKSKPWTDDVTLQENFFTNPFRENDRVTVWFRERVREPLRDDPRVLLATVIFRWFNLPETGEILIKDGSGEYGWLDDWHEKSVVARLSEEREKKRKIFTGAFMINSPGGRPKLEAICDRINNVWIRRSSVISKFKDATTLQGAHKVLTEFPGLGGFMAYEIVCDLRYTYFLENATDVMTWCNPGPGAIRGISRVFDIPFQKGNNASSPPKPKDFDDKMLQLLEMARKKTRLPLEMREIEHSLCEFDKYERARLGDGRMKRKYNGT